MPLRDRQDFIEWAEAHSHAAAPSDEAPATGEHCDGCAQTADQQRLIGAYCMECLACDYGIAYLERRIGTAAAAILTVLVSGDADAIHRLVMHGIDRLADVAEDLGYDMP